MELILFLSTLFILGAAHALEPGHGKLLVTSYLAGNSAKTQDAFLLGILVAVFHTLSVAMLGAVVVFLAFAFFKDTFLNALQILSGVVILGLGLLMFYRRFLKKSSHEHQCDCHVLHSATVEEEAPVKQAQSKTSLKEVIFLGLASGITPCPMALAALVGAFAMGKPLAALGSLAVFSLGIGSILVILGIVMIRGAEKLKAKYQRFQAAPVLIARVSTIILLLLGCYLVAKPMMFPEEKDVHELEVQLLPNQLQTSHQ
jgi:nickel/cobalt transporter (NicO) family protein